MAERIDRMCFLNYIQIIHSKYHMRIGLFLQFVTHIIYYVDNYLDNVYYVIT